MEFGSIPALPGTRAENLLLKIVKCYARWITDLNQEFKGRFSRYKVLFEKNERN